MGKFQTVKSSKRHGKVVVSEAVEEKEDGSSSEGQTETVPPSEQEDKKDEEGPMESRPPVEDSPVEPEMEDKKDLEDEEAQEDEEATDQQTTAEEQTETVPPSEPVDKKAEEGPMESLPLVKPEVTVMEQETEDKKDPEDEEEGQKEEEMTDQQSAADPQMDATPAPSNEEEESTPMVTVTWEMEKNEKGEGNDGEQKTNGSDQEITEETENTDVALNGKRQAETSIESSPSKKTKTINDGFCLFVGNLNSSKTYEEVKQALANYFMTQSILVQDVRLDHSRKYAYIDLASQLDMTKGLSLNGEKLLDQAMRIFKAKVKDVKMRVRPPREDKKDNNDRCLFLKNVPYNTTKKSIMRVFDQAIAVRFPGDTETSSRGIAFVEFKTKACAESVLQKKPEVRMQGRVVMVQYAGEKGRNNFIKQKAAVRASNTLIVKNLDYKAKVKTLAKIFPAASSINIPLVQGKPRGLAFLQFATVEEATAALESSKNTKILDREIGIDFCHNRQGTRGEPVESKTLIVMGLAEDTSEETLMNAFEGAVGARLAISRDTGVCRGFGFVDFDNIGDCKAAREAMEDCEIDGTKVTLDYARPREELGPPGAKGGSPLGLRGQPKGRGGSRGRGGRGGGRGPSGRLSEDEAKGKKVKG